ncbi:HPr kinase/phosphorylase [Phenylobacterium sp.]|jgi:serine kinase of HPr protein (carbohydrate metabolism regulator)|uniref:HPr kinase/phosphorylase n=1 Tax=Phenylobacterium sp. TaxID=1871053 RepID=UPI0037CC0656
MIQHAGLIARRRGGLWRGVLIEGPSGAGKSDLAIRALDHGFRLVADDRVLLWSAGGRLYGRAPDILAGQIEARGQGIARVTPLAFSEITLLVRLGAAERLPDPESTILLGVEIPQLWVDPFAVSAPHKIVLAFSAFDAAHKRRI